jgi:hypothetical protein
VIGPRPANEEPRLTGEGEASAAVDEGMRLFCGGDLAGAHAAFERAHRRSPRDPRAMSWFGVTLVLVEKNSNLGVLYCDQAVRLSSPEPDLALNQARVALALGQRDRAVRAIARGLDRTPGDPGLEAAQSALGRRSRPVLPFLTRGNPLNVWLGKLRARLLRAGPPIAPDTSPLTLGTPPSPSRSRADA